LGSWTIQKTPSLFRRTFTRWQLPDKVEFIDEIPKTSAGKFNKGLLKEKYKHIPREN